MRLVFLDTAYVVALEAADDQHHAAAAQHWQALRKTAPPFFVSTSNIFTEVVTLLNSRGAHGRATDVGKWLLTSPSVQVLHVDRPLFEKAWAYFQQHDDKRYSLTDCISFVVMQDMKISTAFTFDHHFRQAGFLVEPV